MDDRTLFPWLLGILDLRFLWALLSTQPGLGLPVSLFLRFLFRLGVVNLRCVVRLVQSKECFTGCSFPSEHFPQVLLFGDLLLTKLLLEFVHEIIVID